MQLTNHQRLSTRLGATLLAAGLLLAACGAGPVHGLEVTAQPHTGCHKFVDRFGRDAMLFVNSPTGKELNLRGINAKVIRGGTVRIAGVFRHPQR